MIGVFLNYAMSLKRCKLLTNRIKMKYRNIENSTYLQLKNETGNIIK